MKRYVLGFMFSEDKQNVLLILKNHPDWQKGKYNGLGGQIENCDYSVYYKGDKNLVTAKKAMCREFEEECGIKTKNTDWNLFAVMSDKHYDCKCYVSFSNKIFNAQSLTNEKIKIININNLNGFNLIENLNWLIPMSLDSNNFIAEIIYA